MKCEICSKHLWYPTDRYNHAHKKCAERKYNEFIDKLADHIHEMMCDGRLKEFPFIGLSMMGGGTDGMGYATPINASLPIDVEDRIRKKYG